MQEKWSTTRLEDIAAKIAIGPFGSRMKSDCYVKSGVPVIRGTNLTGGKSFTGDWVFVSEQTADDLGNCCVSANDLVFPHRGSIGEVGIVTDEFPRYVMSSSLMKLTCDTSRAVPSYVYYFFKSAQGRYELLKNASQVGTPGIGQPLSSLKGIEIPLPPLPEQRAIAHILGTLDDKIELNRQINETLEAMARALFKSWFVDFDPVRAKAEGRDTGLPKEIADLFLDSFEDSELGEVPKGWRVGVLDELTDVVLGGDWGGDEPTPEKTMVTRCIRGADIPDLQAGGLGKMPIRYLKPSSLEKRRLEEGNLVVEISGGSPTQSTGRPVLVSERLLRRLDAPIVCSNFCRLIKPQQKIYSKFIYLWLRALYTNDEFLQFENGTTGIKNLAFTLFSSSYKLCIPPLSVLAMFDEQVSLLFARQQTGAAESGSLTNFRDTLLPKLISGELRVKDAERSAMEVM